jgi:hypothetical protein
MAWKCSKRDERAMLVIAAAVLLASRYCKRSEDREAMRGILSPPDMLFTSVQWHHRLLDLFPHRSGKL